MVTGSNPVRRATLKLQIEDKFMSNRWHAEQENNMRPDVKQEPCPWCGGDEFLVVDTELIKYELHGENFEDWKAQASCHECGAQSPDTGNPSWNDHPLHNEYLCVDWENEREVVNFAVQVWNCRK